MNERQKKAISFLKVNPKITNELYQKICNTTKSTTTRDLLQLSELGIVTKIDTTGKGTEYVLTSKSNIS